MNSGDNTSPGEPGREGDNMNMQEMIYQENRIPPVRIADGVYRGVPFYVLSLGTHPCAYVDIAPLDYTRSMSVILVAMEVLHITATIWQRLTTKGISWGGIMHIGWIILVISRFWISGTVRGGQPRRW